MLKEWAIETASVLMSTVRYGDDTTARDILTGTNAEQLVHLVCMQAVINNKLIGCIGDMQRIVDPTITDESILQQVTMALTRGIDEN